MAKILYTYNDVDVHVANLKYMYEKDGYIPVYYQMALIKGLSMAPEGIVLYFFAEVGKISRDLMKTYFGSPLDLLDEPAKVEISRIKDLESLL